MHKLPIRKPSPDFQHLEKAIRGEEKTDKVHFVEIYIDEEVMKFITEGFIGEKWKPKPQGWPLLSNESTSDYYRSSSDEKEERQAYWMQCFNFYYQLGFDFYPDFSHLIGFQTIVTNEKLSDDTADLSKGKRVWAEEGVGMISSWKDFEKFPWEKLEKIRFDLEEYFDFVSNNLPEGMKISTTSSLYERVMEWILGYEGLFYLIYDQPDLVKAVFDRWGKIIYDFYDSVVDLEVLGFIWQGDDMGHKTGTIISPKDLREFVFPWFKKYALIAHEHGKMFWLHSDGNVLEIMEDLIEDVKIDAFHAFQDVIMSVGDFKKRYGQRVATLGGVDIDKLCRLDEENLRGYIRKILNECMPGGRYAFGSGNSIPNYTPIKNYLIMLEEGLRWKSSDGWGSSCN